MREAAFVEPLPDGRVHCWLCPHDCRIADASRGACAVRYNAGGTLYTLAYDRIVGRSVEPIEKKPLFHFLPGSTAYSIATAGCSLQCAYCQNWDISQWPRTELPRRLIRIPDGAEQERRELETFSAKFPGRDETPRAIVDSAIASGASSIAYTFTEPTIFIELALETAVLARRAGVKNVFVTSGFTSARALREIAPLVDAANVDLKFFRDESYRRIARASLAPVLEAIELYRRLGVWVEVTTLVVPGVNDSDAELRGMAEFIASVGREVPWHVSRFQPAYKMLDRPVTPLETLMRAREIGLKAGLHHVYVGNAAGCGREDTVCPECGTVVIERHGTRLRWNRLRDGKCPACDSLLDGVFAAPRQPAVTPVVIRRAMQG
jgi:pyruvate formate lyase activating enzyme